LGVIRRQGVTNTIVMYIGLAVGFINIIYIQPKLLTTEVLGLTRILFAAASIIAMLLPLGIGSIAIKYFPLFKDEKTRHHGFFGLLLLFTAIGFCFISALLIFFKSFIIEMYQKESHLFTEYFNLLFPFCIIIALNALFSIYCQVLFKSTIPAFINDVVVRFLNIIFVVLFFFKLYDLNTFINLFIASYLIQTLSLLVYIYLIDKPSIKIDVAFIKQQNYGEIISYGLLLSITAFASLGIKYTDTVFLGKYLPLSMVGIYSVAAFIPTIIEAPIGALERISNAKIADSWSKVNMLEIEKIYYQSTNYLTIFGGFLLTLLLVNINFLYTFLPSEYLQALPVVFVLCFSAYFNMITGLNGSILFSSKYYFYGSLFLIIMLVVSVGLNILLIPKFGIMGAAFSNATASLLFNTLKFIFIKNKYGFQPFHIKHFYFLVLVVALVFGINKLDFATNVFVILFTKNVLAIAIFMLIANRIKITDNNFFKEMFEMVYTKLLKKN